MSNFNFRAETNGNAATFYFAGKLDKVTSVQNESKILAEAENVTELILDCSELAYISSAGLRILLKLQQNMNEKGSLVLRGVNPDVMEIFDITGFSAFLTIETA